jgi:hypothetical protein
MRLRRRPAADESAYGDDALAALFGSAVAELGDDLTPPEREMFASMQRDLLTGALPAGLKVQALKGLASRAAPPAAPSWWSGCSRWRPRSTRATPAFPTTSATISRTSAAAKKRSSPSLGP